MGLIQIGRNRPRLQRAAVGFALVLVLAVTTSCGGGSNKLSLILYEDTPTLNYVDQSVASSPAPAMPTAPKAGVLADKVLIVALPTGDQTNPQTRLLGRLR
jgi:hypothetical protein